MKNRGASLAIERIYNDKGLDGSFARKNSLVINEAIRFGLSLCGSVGCAVATGCPQKEAGDLDFVTDSNSQAVAFIARLESYLSSKKVHYQKLVNHKTKFVPKFCVSHYRLKVSFWMEICVFVIDSKQLKVDSFFRDGVRVQNYRQMYDAAEELTKRDNKVRVSIDKVILEEGDDDVLRDGFEDFIDPYKKEEEAF